MTSTSTLEEKYKGLLETINLYPEQLKHAWDEVGKIDFGEDYKKINKVVVCAMGGSALGARIVDSLLINRIRVPIEVFNQYHIPNYTDDQTLIVSYSYSGNTEEAVACLNEALTRETKIFVVCAGGKLKQIAEEYNLPRYIIDPKYNPSKQPRNSLGYSIGVYLALFTKLGFAHFSNEEIGTATESMEQTLKDYSEEFPESNNLAKSTAKKLKDKAVVLVSSEHLYGTTHSIKNQFNETSKTFATIFELPELNHHALEGLKNPKSIKNHLLFLFFNSNLYSDRVQKRYPLTNDVIEKNGFSTITFHPKSDRRISQVFETLVFGSMVVYYLSKSYGIDPNKIPWVDYFKEKLAKT